MEWILDDGFEVSTDRSRLDLPVIAGFLREAYWSEGVPAEIVVRSIEGSLPLGLNDPDGAQAGFARVVSDRAVFAYLGDVFVLPPFRGRGLGVRLVECVLAHPELQGLRRWHLATADAHELYRRFGFAEPARPDRHMFLDRAPADLY
jgi:GNAT superfamily N-acetyltransferase